MAITDLPSDVLLNLLCPLLDRRSMCAFLSTCKRFDKLKEKDPLWLQNFSQSKGWNTWLLSRVQKGSKNHVFGQVRAFDVLRMVEVYKLHWKSPSEFLFDDFDPFRCTSYWSLIRFFVLDNDRFYLISGVTSPAPPVYRRRAGLSRLDTMVSRLLNSILFLHSVGLATTLYWNRKTLLAFPIFQKEASAGLVISLGYLTSLLPILQGFFKFWQRNDKDWFLKLYLPTLLFTARAGWHAIIVLSV